MQHGETAVIQGYDALDAEARALLGVARPLRFAGTDRARRAVFHLETTTNLLKLLERVLAVALKSLNNQTDSDSAIRKYETRMNDCFV
jgi:hypothetical protein